MTEDQMWNMSDEDLEAAFLEARANGVEATSGDEDVRTEYDQYNEETIELNEDLEQPETMDSDDDLTTDDGAEETTTEDSEETADTTDEGTEDTEEKTEDDEYTVTKEVDEPQSYKFKANGKEYEFTPEEMLSQFPKIFGQAMDYTKKTQALKPWRKTIDALESANLSHDQINLMIDVFKGDKNAIAEVIKRTGVDTLDLDPENSRYVPNDYGRDDTALDIKDVIDEISSDAEYTITNRILLKDWDEKSFKEFTKDPSMIRKLHIDVKDGTYDKVQAMADKLKVLDRGLKTDLEYYIQAGTQYHRDRNEAIIRARAAEEQRLAREQKLARQAEINRVKETQQKQQVIAEKAEVRKAASPTKSNAGQKKVVDYLDDSDEAYEEWYKNNVLNKY